MDRPLHIGRAPAAWATFFVLVLSSAGRVAAEESPNDPIVSFLGVGGDLSVGDERTHELEKDFGEALQKSTGVVIQLPSTLDENLGVETREGLRDSEVLEAHLKEYARVLGDFVVTIRVTRKQSTKSADELAEQAGTISEAERPLLSHIRVLKVQTQKEVFSVTIPSRDTVAVKNVVARIQELGVPDEAPSAPSGAVAEQPTTSPDHTAPPAPSEQHAVSPAQAPESTEQRAANPPRQSPQAEADQISEHPAEPERHEEVKATIQHEPVQNTAAHAPIMLRASAVAPGKFAVTAFYRRSPKDEWASIQLTHTTDAKFEGGLPPLAEGGVDYYVSVTDEQHHELAHSGSASDPHHFEITPPPPPPKPRIWQRDLGWALAAIGVATLAAGVGVGVSFQQEQTRFKQTYEPGSAVTSQLRTINTQAVGADVLLPAGGALAVAGGTLVIIF